MIANPNFNSENLNLVGADIEVNSIKPILNKFNIPISILKHEDATESNFIQKMSEKLGIIHFAGHGTYDPVGQDPWLSGLLFYKSKGYNLLTVTELVNRRFNGTPLFILSACETGRSQISRGDELIGLIRGLTLAGVTSIIATNWLLADEVAPHFMKSFYENFVTGKDVCECLFIARNEIFNFQNDSFKHPLYWGVYTIYGNPFKKLKL